jgi:hypothetical protein
MSPPDRIMDSLLLVNPGIYKTTTKIQITISIHLKQLAHKKESMMVAATTKTVRFIDMGDVVDSQDDECSVEQQQPRLTRRSWEITMEYSTQQPIKLVTPPQPPQRQTSLVHDDCIDEESMPIATRPSIKRTRSVLRASSFGRQRRSTVDATSPPTMSRWQCACNHTTPPLPQRFGPVRKVKERSSRLQKFLPSSIPILGTKGVLNKLTQTI